MKKIVMVTLLALIVFASIVTSVSAEGPQPLDSGDNLIIQECLTTNCNTTEWFPEICAGQLCDFRRRGIGEAPWEQDEQYTLDCEQDVFPLPYRKVRFVSYLNQLIVQDSK